MSKNHVQIVKDFFAAMRSGDMQALLALSAEDIEWIIPGEGWPLAGTHRGHEGLTDLLQKASETLETSYPKPFEFVAQGDRVLVVGFATGKNQSHEEDVRGPLGLRHYRSKWQTDGHPGVYQHTSTGAGLRDESW